MPWRKQDRCKGCGKQLPPELLSARSLCQECGIGVMVTHNQQMHDRAGPAYNLWVRRYTEGMLKYLSEQGAITVTQPPADQ